jgi:tetratricopeptide (TPR) repeat protein
MRRSGTDLGVTVAAWLIVFGNAVLVFFPPPVPHPYVLLLVQHVGVAALLAGALWYAFRETEGGRAWVALGGLVALAFPILGPAAAACLLLPFQPLLARLRPDLEAPGTLEEEGTAPPPARKARPAEAELQAYLDIEPYADLLWSPDPTVKKSVINAIAERPSPQLIGLLRWCLSDPRPDVYQLALAKLGKIQAAHAVGIFHATERTRSHPDSVQAHRGLAQAYEAFAESGLLEGAVQQYYRQMALGSYQAVLAREPGNRAARQAIARLAAGAGRFDEALSAYEGLLQEAGSAEARLGILKVWYERARLTGDREALDRLVTVIRESKSALASVGGSRQDAAALQDLQWWLGVESDG